MSKHLENLVIGRSKNLSPYGFASVGMIMFGATLPVTKLALTEVSPLFVFSVRTLIASVLALFWLSQNRDLVEKAKPVWKEIVISAVGTVIGFPLLTSFALKLTGVSHSALVIALVPLLTSVLAAWLFGARRHWAFWAWAVLASFIVLVTILQVNQISWKAADTLLILSALSVSIGYAFGSKASKHLGGTATISLALVISLPIVMPVFCVSLPTQMVSVQTAVSLGYLGIFSMFLGFVFWYKGLAEGPTEKVSLIQLMQVFVTYGFGHLLLNEEIDPRLLYSACGVVVCLLGAKLSK